MRLSWSLLALAFAARAMAEGQPLCVSAGMGSTDSGADQSLIFVASAALMSSDIEADVMRAELCIGGWYLREKYPFSPGDAAVGGGLRDGPYSTRDSHGYYQAAKASWRTRTLPDHSPLFEFGLGFGVHEEWPAGESLEFVPRAHVSTRFCFFPSRPTSSYIELEALPRVNRAGFEDIGSLFWAKLGYSFRVYP